MKTTLTPANLLSAPSRDRLSFRHTTPPTAPDPFQIEPSAPDHGKLYVRHILLGHPEAVRQTIHLLHTLRYADALLWSRAITLADPLVLPPTPGEVISLLRKQV